MKIAKKIDMYPILAEWLQDHPVPPTVEENVSKFLVWNICSALTKSDFEAYNIWINTIKVFLKNSSNIELNFLEIEAFMAERGLNISTFASDLAFIAIEQGEGESYFHQIKTLADLTNLDAIHFISAWLALNLNQMESCIHEAEKISVPNSSVYTLTGQAYLEMGLIEEATEDLNIAVKISPNEIFGWFQLTKAYLVQGKHKLAWDAAKECLRILPQSEEVHLILSMIAIEMDSPSENRKIAWDLLSATLKAIPESEPVVLNLLQLSFKEKNKEWAAFVAEQAAWPALRSNAYFMKQLGNILRELGEQNWYDISNLIISGLENRAIG